MVPSLTYNRGGLPSGEKASQEQQLIYEVFTTSHFSLKFYISLILSLFNSILFSFFSSGAKGGGQEIKELPRRSPSVHISVGARENGTEGVRERRRGVRVASALGSCSSSLFHCFFGCYFCSCVTSFDQSVHIFNVNVRYNCCKKTKNKKEIANKKKKTLLARVFYFVPLLISKVLFVSFLC